MQNVSANVSTTVVIRCSDYRYHEDRELYNIYTSILSTEKVDINDPFLIFKFGGAIDFLTDLGCNDHLRMVSTIEITGIRKVVLIEHTPGCVGYAVEFGELTEDKECELHLKSITAAKAFFSQHLPDIELTCYLQNHNIDYRLID